MIDFKQQFIDKFKSELNGKDGFSENVITSFDEYFNEKLTQGSEKEVIDNSLSNGRFIRSDVMEAVNSVLYDKQNIGVITKFTGEYKDDYEPIEEYLNNQYTGYTTNDGKPLLVRIKNSNQTHYTADLIDVDGNVIYKIDSNKIKTQTNNNCCIHAFEQTLMLQDLVKFYHDNKITEPALKDFIEKTIEKLKKNKVFEKKEGDHFTKLRKEIYKIYALNKFLDSKETELKADGNYDKIKNYRNTLYNNLLNKESEVKFANYLDFKDGLEQYNNKVADIDKSIKTGDDSQLKKDKDVINILQFLNTTPTNLEDAKKCIDCFGDLETVNIDDLDKWKLKIFIDGASKYICYAVQHEDLLIQNLKIVKQLYKLIKEKDKIKNKLGNNNFDGVNFNLSRALMYVELLTSKANDKKIDSINNESIEKLFDEGGVIEKNVDNNHIKCIIEGKNKNLKNDILEQLKYNKNSKNFDFINIKKDVYVKNQLTQEEFNEILNDDNFKTINNNISKDTNFLFYNKLKSLGIVSGDVSVNVGNFDFSADAQQMTLFPENSKYCLVDAGNGNNIAGGGVNGACQSLLNKKFDIKVEDKVKNIHTLDKGKVVDCGNDCKAQCVSQDKENKVTLLKFYKEEDGKQKDSIFILYATGPDFSIEYKEKINDGLQKLEGTLNSIMNTISNSSSTLSSTDTVIFGGISNAIFAGEYKDKKINNEFNVIDLFNALVYKVKSKNTPPVCNVSFTWGVAKAIDFIDKLEKESKEINIETNILEQFKIDKNDEVYKYLNRYIDGNFNKIFSKAKKLEAPKPTEQYVSSASQSTPEHSTSSVSTPGSSTSSTSTLDASTSSVSAPGNSASSTSTLDASASSTSALGSSTSSVSTPGSSVSSTSTLDASTLSVSAPGSSVSSTSTLDSSTSSTSTLDSSTSSTSTLDASASSTNTPGSSTPSQSTSDNSTQSHSEMSTPSIGEGEGTSPSEKKITEDNVKEIVDGLLNKVDKYKNDSDKKEKVNKDLYEFFVDHELLDKDTGEIKTDRKQEFELIFKQSGNVKAKEEAAETNTRRGMGGGFNINGSWNTIQPKGIVHNVFRRAKSREKVIFEINQNGKMEIKFGDNKQDLFKFSEKPQNKDKHDSPSKAPNVPTTTSQAPNRGGGREYDDELLDLLNTGINKIEQNKGNLSEFKLKSAGAFSIYGKGDKSFIKVLEEIKNQNKKIPTELAEKFKRILDDSNKTIGSNKTTLKDFLEKQVNGIYSYIENSIEKETIAPSEHVITESSSSVTPQTSSVNIKDDKEKSEQSQQQEQQTSNASAQGQNQPTNQPTNQQQEEQQTQSKSNTTTKQKQQAKKAVGNKLNDKILPLMLMMQMMNKQGPGMNPMTMLLPMLLGGDNENGKINPMMMMLLIMNTRSGGMANNPLMMFMMMKMMMEDQKEKDSSKAAKTNEQLTNTSKNLEGATERLNEKRKEQFAIGG